MYSYTEKRTAAIADNATREDRLELFRWMEQHAMCEWNGECFDIDGGLSLYPVYEYHEATEDADEEYVLVDAEVR